MKRDVIVDHFSTKELVEMMLEYDTLEGVLAELAEYIADHPVCFNFSFRNDQPRDLSPVVIDGDKYILALALHLKGDDNEQKD